MKKLLCLGLLNCSGLHAQAGHNLALLAYQLTALLPAGARLPGEAKEVKAGAAAEQPAKPLTPKEKELAVNALYEKAFDTIARSTIGRPLTKEVWATDIAPVVDLYRRITEYGAMRDARWLWAEFGARTVYDDGRLRTNLLNLYTYLREKTNYFTQHPEDEQLLGANGLREAYIEKVKQDKERKEQRERDEQERQVREAKAKEEREKVDHVAFDQLVAELDALPAEQQDFIRQGWRIARMIPNNPYGRFSVEQLELKKNLEQLAVEAAKEEGERRPLTKVLYAMLMHYGHFSKAQGTPQLLTDQSADRIKNKAMEFDIRTYQEKPRISEGVRQMLAQKYLTAAQGAGSAAESKKS